MGAVQHQKAPSLSTKLNKTKQTLSEWESKEWVFSNLEIRQLFNKRLYEWKWISSLKWGNCWEVSKFSHENHSFSANYYFTVAFKLIFILFCFCWNKIINKHICLMCLSSHKLNRQPYHNIHFFWFKVSSKAIIIYLLAFL
jgi:hypothetical protein